MPSPVTDIRALLMQFEKSGLKDLYLRTGDLSVFLAQSGGGANPMTQAVVATAPAAPVSAPHLGLFEPACAPGDHLAEGALIGRIDVLGRKTDVVTGAAGQVAALHFAANDLVEFGEVVAEIAASCFNDARHRPLANAG